MTTSHALWYTSAHEAQIREEVLGELPDNFCLVRTLFSGISRGTESLIASGRVPKEDFERMRAPFMGGALPFPVKYGYASVGIVEEGPSSLLGKKVFSLSPHQSFSHLPNSALFQIGDIPAARALLAANMETALNGLWNAQPGPADKIGIVGGGVVGLLTGYLCAELPGATVHLVDTNPGRRAIALELGMHFCLPSAAPDNCDVVFHSSATASGLNTALAMAGDEATIAELSWFGSGQTATELGGSFHSRQLKLISSQVGRVAASHRARWSFSRRLQAAIELLKDSVLDSLIEEAIPLHQVVDALPTIFAPHSGILCQPITYPHSTH